MENKSYPKHIKVELFLLLNLTLLILCSFLVILEVYPLQRVFPRIVKCKFLHLRKIFSLLYDILFFAGLALFNFLLFLHFLSIFLIVFLLISRLRFYLIISRFRLCLLISRFRLCLLISRLRFFLLIS